MKNGVRLQLLSELQFQGVTTFIINFTSAVCDFSQSSIKPNTVGRMLLVGNIRPETLQEYPHSGVSIYSCSVHLSTLRHLQMFSCVSFSPPSYSHLT